MWSLERTERDAGLAAHLPVCAGSTDDRADTGRAFGEDERSGDHQVAVGKGDGARAVEPKRCRIDQDAAAIRPPDLVVGIGREEQTVRDRKSTRLNSSHLGISYAVFC